jgi:hypothetical protein
MFGKLFDVVFGCSHRHYSFPQVVPTAARRATFGAGTYVVCLDCGKEFGYDWNRMAVVHATKTARRAHSVMRNQAV